MSMESSDFGPKKYDDGMTKQSYKDQTDINKILEKSQVTGTVGWVRREQAQFGDFTDMPDLLEAKQRLDTAHDIFNGAPSEIRREFNQSPEQFFKYVNDPANAEDVPRLLKGLAQPGRQRPARAEPAEPATPEPVPEPEPEN